MRASLVVVAIAVGLAAGLAAAAALGTSGGIVDAGVVAADPACTGTPNVAGVHSTYDPIDGYRLNTVRVTSVGADCRAPDTYRLSLADDTASDPLLAEWSGSAPSGGSADLSAPMPAGGAPVDFVNPGNNRVQVFYVTESP